MCYTCRGNVSITPVFFEHRAIQSVESCVQGNLCLRVLFDREFFALLSLLGH